MLHQRHRSPKGAIDRSPAPHPALSPEYRGDGSERGHSSLGCLQDVAMGFKFCLSDRGGEVVLSKEGLLCESRLSGRLRAWCLSYWRACWALGLLRAPASARHSTSDLPIE